MAKRPPLTRVARLQGSITRNPIKYLTGVLAMIGALGGAIAAVPKIEPYAPAHRLYVREQVAEEQTMKILRDLQIEQAEGKRDATINDLAKWKVEYDKAQDPGIKDLAQKQIDALGAIKRKLDNQIETLTHIRRQY